MTRIRATCPHCGEIDLRPADIALELVRDGAGEVAEGSCYTFSCPTCREFVTKPADTRIAGLLASGGVPTRTLEDRRRIHPETPAGGPAFGYDDLLDLHLLLQRADWFAELESLVG